MFAEPVLGGGEPGVFAEGGGFEIVAEGDICEGTLPGLGPLLRIGGVGFVGPRCRDAEAGMDEQALVAFLEHEGLDDFATAFADGGSLVDEERNVAAEAGGEFSELAVGAIGFGELTQGEEDGGGVATPPTESGTDGDGFFEMDADADGELELGEEESRGLGGEVVLRIGQGGIAAGELDAGGNELNVEGIAEGDRRHEGFEFVEAVRAASTNVEIEIDFGGSELFHWR